MISRATVQRAETGQKISLRFAHQIAHGLGVDYERLTSTPGFPIIMVRPFLNPHNDPGLVDYCNSVAFQLIDALGQIDSVIVIGHSSSLRYRAAPLALLRKQLGVGYVIDGEIRRDGQTGKVLIRVCIAPATVRFDKTFDEDLGDSGPINAVYKRIAAGIALKCTGGIKHYIRTALDVPSVNRNAYLNCLAGLVHIAKMTPADHELAAKYFTKAKEIASDFAGGPAGMALVHIHRGISFVPVPNREALAQAKVEAEFALSIDNTRAEAHAALAIALGILGGHVSALWRAREALKLSPSNAGAYGVIGAALTWSGHAAQAIRYFDQCLSLDPEDAMAPVRLGQKVIAYFLSTQYKKATSLETVVKETHPHPQLTYLWLAAAHGLLGESTQAEEMLAAVPAEYRDFYRKPAPYMRVRDHAHLLAGLKEAGWR